MSKSKTTSLYLSVDALQRLDAIRGRFSRSAAVTALLEDLPQNVGISHVRQRE